ncbi:ankyrin repeat domain-containing protein [Mycolicibacterium sp.]|uniref:ankyrin repeat domain-containing protein n=1 Tax=Mycolicibacterium sp. TaxID=2320850 RepID=UPI0037C810B4
MVDERDRAGRTRLHYAAVDGKLEEVRQLLAEGADVNAREDSGWTPLHFAANQGNLKVTEALLAAGADVNAVNDEGKEPLFCAILAGGLGQALAVAKLLRDNGADPNRVASNGRSPATFVKRLVDEDFKALFD